MKSMNDIKTDMSELYECVKSGSVDLKVADSLANIAGKYLKAEQLQLAREIFVSDGGNRITQNEMRLIGEEQPSAGH